MDVKQMQALVAIADHGTFSAAADALGTVQSNVSSRIQRLEGELDTELVDRASGQLTASGQVVLARSRRILSELASIATDVVALGADVQGPVSIGMIGTTGRWLIPHLLTAQRAEYPLVHLRIMEGTNSTLEPSLVTGKLDLAVVTQPVSSTDLNDVDLFTEDLVLVVPSDSTFARRREPVTLEQLSQLGLLLPLPGTPLRTEIDDACANAGVTLRAIVELDGVRTLASLAFDGHGPAILPATAMSRHVGDRFSAVAISGLPPRRVGLAVRRHGFPATPVRAVRELLFQLVAQGDALPQGVHPLVGAEVV